VIVARRELARLLTQIENGEAPANAALAGLRTRAGRAQVIGVTGAPGTGKSTLVAALGRELRAQRRSLAILSVDPSSPLSGGAILGDRIRMGDLSGDPNVFIRSMASRGAPGGIASATADAVTALDAHGFDAVLIETVGAGQSEVAVARVAPTVVLVEAPGMGDDVQAIKAGIIEIADVVVVNKADRPDADRTAAALDMAIELSAAVTADADAERRWRVPVIKTVATSGEGIAGLLTQLNAHRDWLRLSGEGERRKLSRAREAVLAQLRELLTRSALKAHHSAELEGYYRSVAAGELSADEVARLIAGRVLR
jgi:LAO/AO transport system kinase